MLAALGKTDFGLYGVVGGMTVFIAFLNLLLSSATGRFYAFAEGRLKKAKEGGRGAICLEESRQWFNTAVLVHTLIPLVLILIGYPLGMHAVEYWLVIPIERLDACRWVFRSVCVSCFIGMINVPFQAMYTAKQYIAELTIFSFAQTTVNVFFVYYMVTHPGDWLAKYAMWMCFVAVLPQIIIGLRAIKIFPECRFRPSYLWNRNRIIQLSAFAFWQSFGGLGVIFRGQGIQILINKYFGPGFNASMSIANQVSGQTQTLASAIQGAFQPAIVTAFGAGDVVTAQNLAHRASKFALLLTLIFCIPLSIEIKEVMRLWLVTPPPYSAGLCLCMLVFFVVDKASIGQCLVCNATGKIAAYQAVGGGLLIMCLPIAWILVASGFNVYSIGLAIIITGLGNTISRVCFSRKLVGMSIRKWMVETILPTTISTLCGLSVGYLVTRVMKPTLLRVCVTIGVVEVVFLTIAWLVVLRGDERSFAIKSAKKILRHR